ncbi:MAG: aldolase/citrate lyase family protein [Thermoguttaceae bacterium]
MKRLVLSAVVCATLCVLCTSAAKSQQGQAAEPAKIYNTVKQKLIDGKQVVGGTVFSPDPNVYSAMANAGFDYLWIEMQHSPLSYQDVARMIWASRGSPAIPFIRVPDATEGDIQKAVDIGALGIVVPMVDTAEKAQAAVKWAKYPPQGHRSQGAGQYGALWGNDYRQTANDNIIIVIMVETPLGVENIEKIAAVPGVDVIFVAATDLGSFSGYRQGEPKYEALVNKVQSVVLKTGIKLGGPLAWKGNRQGYSFFQGPDDTALVKLGAQAILRPAPAQDTRKPGVAPIEGSEPR